MSRVFLLAAIVVAALSAGACIVQTSAGTYDCTLEPQHSVMLAHCERVQTASLP